MNSFAAPSTSVRLDTSRFITFARDIKKLCAEIANPIYRARSFIYPTTDPGVNPYLRRSAFC